MSRTTPADATPLPAAAPIVLLAEDSAVNRHVVAAMLQRLGCRVETVADGRAAVESARRSGPALCLMDCHMPELDGRQATRAIRAEEAADARRRRLPIVAMTARALAEDRAGCAAAGMDECVAKPVTLEQLRDVLARHGVRVTGGADPVAGTTSRPADVLDPRPVLERATLDGLRALKAGMLHQLIDLYAQTAPPLVETLRRAAQAGDATAVAEAAHRLKSSSGNVGALGLAELCGDLEQRARRGALGDTSVLVEALVGQFAAVQQALARERSLP